MSALDLRGLDAWRVLSPYGEIQGRDVGLYSGGATEGQWFTLGYLPDDPEMVGQLAGSELAPVGGHAKRLART